MERTIYSHKRTSKDGIAYRTYTAAISCTEKNKSTEEYDKSFGWVKVYFGKDAGVVPDADKFKVNITAESFMCKPLRLDGKVLPVVEAIYVKSFRSASTEDECTTFAEDMEQLPDDFAVATEDIPF